MFSGEKINVAENRAVLHVAQGEPMMMKQIEPLPISAAPVGS